MDKILLTPLSKLIKAGVIKTVREDEPLVDAISLMDELDVSALLVLNELGRYTGVLSRTDIASKKLVEALKFRKLENLMVREMMNHTTPACLKEGETLGKAVSLMHSRHFSRVFITDDDGHLRGIISSSDILRILVVENGQAFADRSREAQRKHFEKRKERHDAFMEDSNWESI
jgi:CBS domain-containing protein